MKRFNRALLGATALTAIAGMGFAQSNDAHTFQSSNNNSLLIHQNQSGATPGSNVAGSAVQPISQHGDDNDIDITQTSSSSVNHVGTGGDQVGNGVDQIGDNNKLMITQTGGGNKVFDVQQKGGVAINSNDTTIDQSGSNHAVSNISQTFVGLGGSDANQVTIHQSGSRHYVGNTVSGPRGDGSGITQKGHGNEATVNQSGAWQKVYTLKQENRKNSAGSNTATITQSGNAGTANGNLVREVDQYNNGALDNTLSITQVVTGNGDNGKGGFAGAAAQGVALVALGNQSYAKQSGSDNDLAYSTIGEANKFGFLQQGVGNDINSTSNGIGQEVAIRQNGSGNQTFAMQTGAYNSAGVQMDGDGNFIDFSQASTAGSIADGNSLIIALQPGSDDNTIRSTQTGLNNEADLWVKGDRNKLNVNQDSSSAGNTMMVTIKGNDNNNYNISPALSGDADWARDQGIAFSSFGSLNQGDLFQKGDTNDLTLNVTGNSNAFAMLQDGSNNTINGTFTHGSSNQAVVAQVSSGDSATFTIGGVGNNLGIVQGN